MFSLLGKKEIIGTTLWLGPVGLSVMGYLNWSPFRSIEVVIVGVVVTGALIALSTIVRFMINYRRGPRMPLG